MRLLNTRTLKLEDRCLNKSLPKYAILSHTWGKDEVTFQELGSLEMTKKEGYAKIKKTCEIALQNGIYYAWVDVCCIDKTSSAELSEAINSMFKWYRDAQVCYVYLSDVEAGPDMDKSPLAESRWFTRGWTLQELIAPPKLIFFASDWSQMFTREEVSNKLSRITGINESYFFGNHGRHVNIVDPLLSRASVAEKMSWASKRETTRIEDMAYCLLGIFGVNMPLLYGEGDRAFLRLQKEIAQSSSDQSLFAWCATKEERLLLRHGVFASSPADFAKSDDIIPCHVGKSTLPFELTKYGVRITLPVYDGNAILECKRKGDHCSLVVLGLKKRGNVYYRSNVNCLGHVDCRAWDNWSKVTLLISTDTPTPLQLVESDRFYVRSTPEGFGIKDYSNQAEARQEVRLPNNPVTRGGLVMRVARVPISKSGNNDGDIIAILGLSARGLYLSNYSRWFSNYSRWFWTDHYFMPIHQHTTNLVFDLFSSDCYGRSKYFEMSDGILYAEIRQPNTIQDEIFLVDIKFSPYVPLRVWLTDRLWSAYQFIIKLLSWLRMDDITMTLFRFLLIFGFSISAIINSIDVLQVFFLICISPRLILYLVLYVGESLSSKAEAEDIEFLAMCLLIFWICQAKTRHRLQFYDTRSRLANETEVSGGNGNNIKYYIIISLLVDFLYIAKAKKRE